MSTTSAPPSAAPSISAAAIVGDDEPHVAPDRDPPRLELLDVGAADRVRAVLVELGRVDAADVVCLEDLRVEHGADAMAAAALAREDLPGLLAPRRRARPGSRKLQPPGDHVRRHRLVEAVGDPLHLGIVRAVVRRRRAELERDRELLARVLEVLA